MERKRKRRERGSSGPSPELLASLERHAARGVPMVKVADLVPWIENPRDNAAAVPAVVASLQRFGWTNPVLYRADGRMVEAGHTRLLAAHHLGITEVPAIALDHDTQTARLYALADNRLNELAGWTPGIVSIMEGFDAPELALAGWEDPAAWLEQAFSLGADAPDADPYAPGNGDVGVLTRRFGAPPVSVLDARGGYWLDRKRNWVALGLRSWEGRENLHLSTAGVVTAPRGMAAGGSLFDPVLAELLVRWFCPPGGTVLDPFAGGSVRGVVSAACGRSYVGIDLRHDQVVANRKQWDEIAPRLPALPAGQPPGDFTPEVTPTEDHGGILFKREDRWVRGGARGAKSRTMFRVCEATGAKGVISAGARISPQIERAAMVAKALDLPCHVHTGIGPLTSETDNVEAMGGRVIRTGTRLSMYLGACKRDAEANPTWAFFPFGMGMAEYVEDVAYQAERLPWGTFARLLTPCGSGATLAGILVGMARADQRVPVSAVRLGKDPDGCLDRFAPAGWRDWVEFIDGGEFDRLATDTVLHGVRLDPMYEAKMIPHVQPGDLLWLVGMRESSYAKDTQQTIQRIPPVWHTGDSAEVLPSLEVAADMILSCPPYADLEVYSDDPADLSNMPYDRFLAAYREIIAASMKKLKDDRWIGWVIGEVRNPKTGIYRNLVADTVQAFVDAGASYYNEAILVTGLGSVPIRAGRQFQAARKLGKTHQNVLVFCKGDPKRATLAVGEVDFGAAEGEPTDGEP